LVSQVKFWHAQPSHLPLHRAFWSATPAPGATTTAPPGHVAFRWLWLMAGSSDSIPAGQGVEVVAAQPARQVAATIRKGDLMAFHPSHDVNHSC